jgi:hypothetical protein
MLLEVAAAAATAQVCCVGLAASKMSIMGCELWLTRQTPHAQHGRPVLCSSAPMFPSVVCSILKQADAAAVMIAVCQPPVAGLAHVASAGQGCCNRTGLLCWAGGVRLSIMSSRHRRPKHGLPALLGRLWVQLCLLVWCPRAGMQGAGAPVDQVAVVFQLFWLWRLDKPQLHDAHVYSPLTFLGPMKV